MSVIKAIPSQTLTFKDNDVKLVEGDLVEVVGDLQVAKVADGTAEVDGVVVVGSDEFGYATVLINAPLLQLTANEAVTAGSYAQAGVGGQGIVAYDSVNSGIKVGLVVQGADAGKKALVAYK